MLLSSTNPQTSRETILVPGHMHIRIHTLCHTKGRATQEPSFENYIGHPYLSEYAIVDSLLLWFRYNAEHKLKQVDGILEAEGAETKLIFNSVLPVRE